MRPGPTGHRTSTRTGRHGRLALRAAASHAALRAARAALPESEAAQALMRRLEVRAARCARRPAAKAWGEGLVPQRRLRTSTPRPSAVPRFRLYASAVSSAGGGPRAADPRRRRRCPPRRRCWALRAVRGVEEGIDPRAAGCP